MRRSGRCRREIPASRSSRRRSKARQNHQRHRHRPRRFVHVVLGFVVHARVAEKRHVHQPEHVKRRHARGDEADGPQRHVVFRTLRRESASLLKKPAQRRNSGDGDRRDQKRPVGDWNFAPQRAHLAHVLLAGHARGSRCRTARKSSALKNAWVIKWKMPAVNAPTPQRQEHVAELATRSSRPERA